MVYVKYKIELCEMIGVLDALTKQTWLVEQYGGPNLLNYQVVQLRHKVKKIISDDKTVNITEYNDVRAAYVEIKTLVDSLPLAA